MSRSVIINLAGIGISCLGLTGFIACHTAPPGQVRAEASPEPPKPRYKITLLSPDHQRAVVLARSYSFCSAGTYITLMDGRILWAVNVPHTIEDYVDDAGTARE